MFNRSVVFVCSLVAAITCYLIHFQTGAIVALVTGILLELAFWFNLIGVTKEATNKLSGSAKDQ